MPTIKYLTHAIRTAKSSDRLFALNDLCRITGPARADKAAKLIPAEHQSREIVETTSGDQVMRVVDPQGIVLLAEARGKPEVAAWARQRFGVTTLAGSGVEPLTIRKVEPVTVHMFGGYPIRVLEGDPRGLRFVAADCCEAIDLDNVAMAVQALEGEDKGFSFIDTPGGPQDMIVLFEPGLYQMAFRSNKDAARRFTRWVTREVLPEIRRTGSYSMPGALAPGNADASPRMSLEALQFPPPSGRPLPPRQLIRVFHVYVRRTARALRCHPAAVYELVYEEFYVRYGIDYAAKKRTQSRELGWQVSSLQLVASDGRLEDLYDVAVSMFGRPAINLIPTRAALDLYREDEPPTELTLDELMDGMPMEADPRGELNGGAS